MVYVLYGRATTRHNWRVQMIGDLPRVLHWKHEYSKRYPFEYTIRKYALSGAIVQGVDYPDNVRTLPQGDDTR